MQSFVIIAHSGKGAKIGTNEADTIQINIHIWDISKRSYFW